MASKAKQQVLDTILFHRFHWAKSNDNDTELERKKQQWLSENTKTLAKLGQVAKQLHESLVNLEVSYEVARNELNKVLKNNSKQLYNLVLSIQLLKKQYEQGLHDDATFKQFMEYLAPLAEES